MIQVYNFEGKKISIGSFFLNVVVLLEIKNKVMVDYTDVVMFSLFFSGKNL